MSDKTSQLAKDLQVSEDIANALLLKNSWDEKEAIKAFKTVNYMRDTFKLDMFNEKVQPAHIAPE